MKPKGKLKKKEARYGRVPSPSAENVAKPPDLSQLRKPVDVNLSSLKQVAQLLDKGSDEVKSVLTYECDIVYECRVCRSLFRSLANFISHKRVYCIQKYCAAQCRPNASQLYRTLCAASVEGANAVISGESRFERVPSHEDRSDSIVRGNASANADFTEDRADRTLRSRAAKVELKKDLTAIVDMLTKRLKDDADCEPIAGRKRNNPPFVIAGDGEKVLLEIIEPGRAAYQTVLGVQESLTDGADPMKSQALELKNMLNRNTGVLGPDGQLLEANEMSANERSLAGVEIAANIAESGRTTCTICDAKFATKKTLTFHMKSKHMTQRVCYPCPCCTGTFTNRWSVYRHLFKVHRKTNEQVRRLRTQIQARSFRRDSSRLEKARCAEIKEDGTAKEDKTLIAREWKENVELDAELQRCSGCGRRFERKAALVSHLQICQKRIALMAAREARLKRGRKMLPRRVGNIVQDKETRLLRGGRDDKGSASTETIGKESRTARDEVRVNGSETSIRTSSSSPRSSPSGRKSSSSERESEVSSSGRKREIPEVLKSEEPPVEDESRIAPASRKSKVSLTNRKSPPREENYALSHTDRESYPSSMKNSARAPSSIERSDTMIAVVPNLSSEITIRVEDVSSLSKDVWDKIGINNADRSRSSDVTNEEPDDKATSDSPTDMPEVIYTSIENSRPVALSVLATEQKLGIQYRGIRLPTVTLEKINLSRDTSTDIDLCLIENDEPSAALSSSHVHEILLDEESNGRAQTFDELQCLRHARRSLTSASLQRHANAYARRNRYRCRLCHDLKSLLKCDIVAHCNKVHNARNDRATLADLLIDVPISVEEAIADAAEMRNENGEEDLEVMDLAGALSRDKATEKETMLVDEPYVIDETRISNAQTNTKPRRGRPPKVGMKKKRRTLLARRKFSGNVSPPRLSVDSFSNDENDVATIERDDIPCNDNGIKDSCPVTRTPSKMDGDPELRRMIMEVIFGSAQKDNPQNSRGEHEERLGNVANDDFRQVLDH